MIVLKEEDILGVNGGLEPFLWGYTAAAAMNWMLYQIANLKNPGSWDDGSYFSNLKVP